MHFVYLSLGSNLGDRKKYIGDAEIHIEKFIGIITSKSGLYETEPWGTDHPEMFLNKVILVESELSPFQMFEKIQAIEKLIGRIRNNEKYSPRIIDIDILFFDELILDDKNLTIPHPLIKERKFVLKPLTEIANQFVHPVFNKTIQQMFKECKDEHVVRKIN
jgi:2-amino-4-hydroxy-6-hydroxymethyldihydropteridine diphosphokinase